MACQRSMASNADSLPPRNRPHKCSAVSTTAELGIDGLILFGADSRILVCCSSLRRPVMPSPQGAFVIVALFSLGGLIAAAQNPPQPTGIPLLRSVPPLTVAVLKRDLTR